MTWEVQDHYFRMAKQQGYRSRAAFKLLEIDERKKILKAGDCVLDCGAAPGSWTQVVLKRIGPKGKVVAIDLQPIKLGVRDPRVRIIQGDLTKIPAGELLTFLNDTAGDNNAKRFDVVLSDMAPSTTGERALDHFGSIRLCEAVLDRVPELLKIGGTVVMKVLEGEAYPDLLARCKSMFDSVKGFKPKASRSESTEMFVIAEGCSGR